MVEITVMTRLGEVTLFPGDVFQCSDTKHKTGMYQYICKADDEMTGFYLLDMTHEKYMNVHRGWFLNRSVRKIGGHEDG